MTRGRALGLGALLVTALGVGTWALLRREVDRPPITDVGGDHPGDLTPNLEVDDDVRNYGLDVALPYHFSTDSLGFRAKGRAAPSGSGPRVLVLGDSFAFGMGVPDIDTFASRLEAELTSEGAVVYNAGVPGYTITDSLEQWSSKLGRFPVDVVLLCHTASDIPEMGRPTSLRRFLAWDDEAPNTDPEVARVVAGYASKRAAAEAQWMLPADQRLKQLGASAPRIFAAWQSAWASGLFDLAARVEQGGARFVLVLWAEGYGHFGASVQGLVEATATHGVATFRGQAALAKSGVHSDRLFLPDKHFSAEGNALAARQTAAWLRDQVMLSAPH